MKPLTIPELKDGMILEQAVYTKSGQKVLPSGTVLTQQMILRLSFYNIRQVFVIQADELNPSFSEINSSSEENKVEEIPSTASFTSNSTTNNVSYLDKVRDSVEYKHFKNTYIENVDYLTQFINDIILKSDLHNDHSLLNQMLDFFDSLQDQINVFEILHDLRKADNATYTHSINVAIICRLVGQWLHYSNEDIDVLTLCGLLHDIGKCNIPSSILSKPDKLTEEEYATIKHHSVIGYEILKDLPLDPRVRRAALMHHERCDGSGYPLGLVCEDIDPFSIIVSIADVYDAMTTNRCYRKAYCPFEVIETFEQEGFNKYNKDLINTFLNHIVDTYMHTDVILNNGNHGQIVLKNKNELARPTLYLPTKEFLDLSKHPELHIKKII